MHYNYSYNDSHYHQPQYQYHYNYHHHHYNPASSVYTPSIRRETENNERMVMIMMMMCITLFGTGKTKRRSRTRTKTKTKTKTKAKSTAKANSSLISTFPSSSNMINLILILIHHLSNFHLALAESCPQFIATSSSSESGNISSPNYPLPYPADADCTYLLQGSDWQGMKITFHDFDLEPPYTAGCLSDYIDLDIYDLRDRMTFHRRFCGSTLPGPLLVLHPKAKLVFRSNHAVHHRGFFATYEFVDEGDVMPPKVNGSHKQCGELVTGNGGGIIQFQGNKNDMSMPPFGLDCLWLLRVSYNHRIFVRIQELELQGSIENCQKAQLGVYDGYEHSLDDGTVLKKFCGDKRHYKGEDDRALLSSRNRLLVRFSTSVKVDLSSNNTNSSGVGQKARELERLDKSIGFKIIWSEVSSDETPDACVAKKRFPCKETRACISKDHLGTFSSCPALIYCISSELVCDGIPHCAETDASDERHCFGRSLSILIIVGPITLLVILTVASCTILLKRRDLLKQISCFSSSCWKKEKAISAYVLDNPNMSPFMGISRLERLSTMNRGQMDNSSIESASICPMSDSESSDISICPYHGQKYMNHLPVLHEVYNIDSDDSSVVTPTPDVGVGSSSCQTNIGLTRSGQGSLRSSHHNTNILSPSMGSGVVGGGGCQSHSHSRSSQLSLSPPPSSLHHHNWRLKNRPIKRTNAVCVSDDCKSSSGDESPCLCGIGIGNKHDQRNMNMILSTSHMLNNMNNVNIDKIEDSGIELLDSFDLHSISHQPCEPPPPPLSLSIHPLNGTICSGGGGGGGLLPNLKPEILHRSISVQTDEQEEEREEEEDEEEYEEEEYYEEEEIKDQDDEEDGVNDVGFQLQQQGNSTTITNQTSNTNTIAHTNTNGGFICECGGVSVNSEESRRKMLPGVGVRVRVAATNTNTTYTNTNSASSNNNNHHHQHQHHNGESSTISTATNNSRTNKSATNHNGGRRRNNTNNTNCSNNKNTNSAINKSAQQQQQQFNSFCSTVTTFGVYPESTSTDV